MRTVMWRAAGDGLDVAEMRVVEASEKWCHHEFLTTYRVALVHKGVFGVRADAREGLADPITAYVSCPGQEHAIAHRPGAEDAYTVITVDDETADELGVNDRSAASLWLVPIAGRVDLARRVLAVKARGDVDAFEVTDSAVLMLRGLLDGAGLTRTVSSSPDTAAARRRLVESARRRLACAPHIGSLAALARSVGTSRSHLSRVFHQETGETLTRWRTRLRVQAALEYIEAGATDLTRLAARLGFCDHAHLTRTVRREVDVAPRRIRQLLAPPTDCG